MRAKNATLKCVHQEVMVSVLIFVHATVKFISL